MTGSVLLSKAISKSYSSSLSLIPSSLRRFDVIFWTLGSLVLPRGVAHSWVVVIVIVVGAVIVVEHENPSTGSEDDSNWNIIISRMTASERPQKRQPLKDMVSWLCLVTRQLRDGFCGITGYCLLRWHVASNYKLSSLYYGSRSICRSRGFRTLFANRYPNSHARMDKNLKRCLRDRIRGKILVVMGVNFEISLSHTSQLLL
jgi:hypothetical protein